MTDWGYKTTWSVSFDLPVDEKMKEFIDKMDKEHKEIEDVFTARIKRLFEQYVGLDGEANRLHDKLLVLFSLGYQFGWNDHINSLIDKPIKWECVEDKIKEYEELYGEEGKDEVRKM